MPTTKPLGNLEVSTLEGRSVFHILTKASAEQIVAFFAKHLFDKNVDFVQDEKNHAKFTFKKVINDDEDEDGGEQPVDSCTISVKIMRAEEDASVQVIEFQRKLGSSLLL